MVKSPTMSYIFYRLRHRPIAFTVLFMLYYISPYYIKNWYQNRHMDPLASLLLVLRTHTKLEEKVKRKHVEIVI